MPPTFVSFTISALSILLTILNMVYKQLGTALKLLGDTVATFEVHQDFDLLFQPHCRFPQSQEHADHCAFRQTYPLLCAQDVLPRTLQKIIRLISTKPGVWIRKTWTSTRNDNQGRNTGLLPLRQTAWWRAKPSMQLLLDSPRQTQLPTTISYWYICSSIGCDGIRHNQHPYPK